MKDISANVTVKIEGIAPLIMHNGRLADPQHRLDHCRSRATMVRVAAKRAARMKLPATA